MLSGHREAEADVVVLEVPVVDQDGGRLQQGGCQHGALRCWLAGVERAHTQQCRRYEHCSTAMNRLHVHVLGKLFMLFPLIQVVAETLTETPDTACASSADIL